MSMTEILFEADKTKSAPESGIDFNEAHRSPESDLLDRNNRAIADYTAKMVNHFDKVLQGVPAWMQASLIEDMKVLSHEPIYAGMIDKYNVRMAG